MNNKLGVLYSFRRCPYAMRARLGLLFAGVSVDLREVVLKNKPPQMLAISPKGTVPVLQLADGTVIEESRDIMLWALNQNDPQCLLDNTVGAQAKALIDQNDTEFKYWLDRYKYADRYLDMSQEAYRQKGEQFLRTLEALLTQHPYLLASASVWRILPLCRSYVSSLMLIVHCFIACLMFMCSAGFGIGLSIHYFCRP
nr:glutathione S-transferase N-terminal domain-containing protein [Psychrobacter sp. PraFG1]UNK06010.1 glutathione S-transferase N-terminal domain-containing protein [Psychrobacter sp. PraFG1]